VLVDHVASPKGEQINPSVSSHRGEVGDEIRERALLNTASTPEQAPVGQRPASRPEFRRRHGYRAHEKICRYPFRVVFDDQM
jgi:hypothetical protein